MSDKTKSKGGVWQFIKFALFSASAGIIQILSFTLRERVCQDDFCKFSKFKYLSAEKTPNISCRHIS